MVTFRIKGFLFQNLPYILKIVTDYGLMKRDTVVMKYISQEVSMKKVKIKRKYVLLTLVSLFIGYVGLRYYIKPDLIDSQHIYHKVYNLKVTHKKRQIKVIQDINIEFIYNEEGLKPTDGQWEESTRTDLKSEWNHTILHLTFTDKTKLDIIFDNHNRGTLFSKDIHNYKHYKKIARRFPGIEYGDGSASRTYLMLYQGDTIYQSASNQYVVTSFQLKNPKTQKLQTYYEYNVAPEFNFFQPIYFLQDKSFSAEERQEFFDDYQSDGRRNYWIRSSDEIYGGSDSVLNNRFNIELNEYPYQLFYSEEFTNLPIHNTMSGDTFKTTITETYVMGQQQDHKGIRVQSRSKTYTNENKDQYVTEILNKNINKK